MAAPDMIQTPLVWYSNCHLFNQTFQKQLKRSRILTKKTFFQIHWNLCLARWGEKTNKHTNKQTNKQTKNKDRKLKRLSIIAKLSKHVTSQPRPLGLLTSAILERKSIKINDRDHNLWARETEHPTQTLVLVSTSYMITIVYRHIVPLL